MKDAGGAGQDEVLLQNREAKFPTDWTRDGRFLLFSQNSPKTASDLWVLPLEGDRKPVPFLATEFLESQGQFSPDARWIAYTSNESGRLEVYVRPFPAAAAKWKISIDGGQFPRWRRDGKELFYLSLERKLMTVAVKAAVSGTRSSFEIAAPQALFDTLAAIVQPGFNRFQYAVAANGQRFLVNTAGAESAEAPLTVVVQ